MFINNQFDLYEQILWLLGPYYAFDWLTLSEFYCITPTYSPLYISNWYIFQFQCFFCKCFHFIDFSRLPSWMREGIKIRGMLSKELWDMEAWYEGDKEWYEKKILNLMSYNTLWVRLRKAIGISYLGSTLDGSPGDVDSWLEDAWIWNF